MSSYDLTVGELKSGSNVNGTEQIDVYNQAYAGKNEGITIEFRTNADTVAGNYEGTFVLTVDGTKVNIPVIVSVRDIDLSTTHNMGATAASMGNITTETYEMLMND